jgi:hypothetical protein
LRRLGDKVPRQSLTLGPDLTLDLIGARRPSAVSRPADTDRIALLLYALDANPDRR